MDDNSLEHALGELSREESERLSRYLAGQCTPAESGEVEQWLAADPLRAELAQRIRRARLVAGIATDLWDTGKGWARLQARLEGEAARSGQPAATAATEPPARVLPFRPRPAVLAPLRQRTRLAGPLRVAAVLAMVVGAGVLWQNRAAILTPPEVAMRELSAGVGQRLNVTLGDGTSVVLGPESRLSFPERFGAVREVRLEGEAVFAVATDSARAFRVRTAGSVTEVLGTRFGVRAYAEDEYVEVVVAEGQVAVAAVDATEPEVPRAGGRDGGAVPPGVRLTPGMAVRVERDGTLLPTRVLDAGRALSWTEGRLAFEGAPLSEVARTLQRRYGVEVELADPSVAALRLTAEFLQPQRIAEVVRLISLSLGIEYRRTNDGYLLFHSNPTVDPVHDGGLNR